MPDNFVLITGCSGGGKSALLTELARRGFAVCEEPGRTIVREQLASGGDALPWKDAAKFAELAARRSIENMVRGAGNGGITFFDRGSIDAVCALERMNASVPQDIADAFAQRRYNRTVFLAPPWREIFETDPERKHGFEESLVEYEHLEKRLPELGYEAVTLPKTRVAGRADFVLNRL
jgi:predicted ATPase